MFNKKKNKIEPGMICYYDIKNKKKRDITDTLTVQTIREFKSIDRSNKNIWEVRDVSLPESRQKFTCEEELLVPVKNTVCIIRNPIDMPVFNPKDILEMENVIHIVYMYTKDLKPGSENYEDYKDSLTRLEAILDKIRFCYFLRNERDPDVYDDRI